MFIVENIGDILKSKKKVNSLLLMIPPEDKHC